MWPFKKKITAKNYSSLRTQVRSRKISKKIYEALLKNPTWTNYCADAWEADCDGITLRYFEFLGANIWIHPESLHIYKSYYWSILSLARKQIERAKNHRKAKLEKEFYEKHK